MENSSLLLKGLLAKANLLTNDQTACALSIKPNTLENWRLRGKGPRYIKVGRSVRYAEADVIAWLEAQTYSSTSQYATGECKGEA